MKETNKKFNQYVGAWIRNYQDKKKYTIDKMSEKLKEDSRSYSDQEKGRMGFSGKTISLLLILLSDYEVLEFVEGLKKDVWIEDDKNIR